MHTAGGSSYHDQLNAVRLGDSRQHANGYPTHWGCIWENPRELTTNYSTSLRSSHQRPWYTEYGNRCGSSRDARAQPIWSVSAKSVVPRYVPQCKFSVVPSDVESIKKRTCVCSYVLLHEGGLKPRLGFLSCRGALYSDNDRVNHSEWAIFVVRSIFWLIDCSYYRGDSASFLLDS